MKFRTKRKREEKTLGENLVGSNTKICHNQWIGCFGARFRDVGLISTL
jgi:hypothetical protein